MYLDFIEFILFEILYSTAYVGILYLFSKTLTYKFKFENVDQITDLKFSGKYIDNNTKYKITAYYNLESNYQNNKPLKVSHQI